MDSESLNILQWNADDIVYRCHFGELPLFKIKISGLKSSPNIFEVPAQVPTPAPNIKSVSHAYSLPCDADIKPGISIKKGYIHHVYSVYKHYFVNTSGTFDSYMSRFKGKSLNSLKRKIKKINRTNTNVDSLRVFSDAKDVQEFLSIAKQISKQSYQEKLLGRKLPSDQSFINKLTKLAESNAFRGFILYAENTPIAYNLCPIYGNGILLYDYTGYDPKYSQYSAGTVLQFHIIDYCFKDKNISTYDLCSGEGQHKQFFATDYKYCCDVFYFPLTPFYFIAVYTKFLIEQVSRTIISILDKLGVKGRIKRFIRRLK